MGNKKGKKAKQLNEREFSPTREWPLLPFKKINEHENETTISYETVEYNIENPFDYLPCITNLRTEVQKKNDGASSSGSNDQITVINIELKLHASVLTMKMTKHNLYIVGFDNGKKLWEVAHSKLEKPIFKKSNSLGFGENYNDFAAGGLGNVKLGYWNLRNAVQYLLDGDDVKGDDTKWKAAFATIVLMISESTRFHWLLRIINEMMVKCLDVKKEMIWWIELLLKNWETLSEIAREYDPKIKQTEQEENDEKEIKKTFDLRKLLKVRHKKLASEIVAVLCNIKKKRA